MEREIIKIVTPISKQEIVLKAWLTGREKRALNQPYMANLVEDANGEMKPKEVTGDFINQVEDLAIKTIVVSVDGKTEDVLDLILDLKAEDFNFVVRAINNLTNPKKETNPTNTESGIAGGGIN